VHAKKQILEKQGERYLM
jgi:hypothetical protein